MTAREFGLEEDWVTVQRALEQVIPVYDRTNRYISLGTDLDIRKKGLSMLDAVLSSEREPIILDLGAGPGKMTQLLGLPTVMVDALAPMMKVAGKRNSGSQGLLAVFENLPFRKGSIDGSMAGFAIRDARNLPRALSEISSVLKDGGHFLIVDLSKPDSRLKSGLNASYWRLFAPLLATIAAGRLGLKFGALSKTYSRLPKDSVFRRLALEAGFELAESKYYMRGGVTALLLRKSFTPKT